MPMASELKLRARTALGVFRVIAALKQGACLSLVSGALYEHNLSGTADLLSVSKFSLGRSF